MSAAAAAAAALTGTHMRHMCVTVCVCRSSSSMWETVSAQQQILPKLVVSHTFLQYNPVIISGASIRMLRACLRGR